MAGIIQKVKFIYNSVSGQRKDDNTVRLLNELKDDYEYLPVYKVPISILAIAALSVLGIESYEGDDEDVLLWQENLIGLSI